MKTPRCLECTALRKTYGFPMIVADSTIIELPQAVKHHVHILQHLIHAKRICC